MTRSGIIYTEAVITAVSPQKVIRWADECLVEIRLVESFQKAGDWLYEFEVQGEIGKIEKLKKRIKKMETGE